ncbi:MAG: DUF1385 domain-containing protein [Firmicutes bacterium]|nr:DUF1385 domain-containing protein [Bacillota bacterium]
MSELKLFGHALIEGVSISGPQGRAAAVRNEDGDIIYRIKREQPAKGGAIGRLLREAGRLWQGLLWSARQVGETADEPLGPFAVCGSLLGSLILGLLVFIFIPVAAGVVAGRFLPAGACCLIEGLLRAGFLLLFLLHINRFNDLKRLKGYKAAANQAAAAYEAQAELSPDSLSTFSPLSRRDGLAVVLTAALVLIVIFSFLTPLPAGRRILIKLLLLLAAVFAGDWVWRRACRQPEDSLCRILLAPTRPLQSLLTRRPDPSQQEVAIAALLAVPDIGGIHVEEARRAAALNGTAATPALSSAAAAAAYMRSLDQAASREAVPVGETQPQSSGRGKSRRRRRHAAAEAAEDDTLYRHADADPEDIELTAIIGQDEIAAAMLAAEAAVAGDGPEDGLIEHTAVLDDLTADGEAELSGEPVDEPS